MPLSESRENEVPKPKAKKDFYHYLFVGSGFVIGCYMVFVVVLNVVRIIRAY